MSKSFVKTSIRDMPNKHIQIFLHPYLFDGELDGLPNYIKVMKLVEKVHNHQITSKLYNIAGMCAGLDEEHVKGSLLTCHFVVFFYSNNNKLVGIMGCNLKDDVSSIHVDIVCTNSNEYAGIGTYLIELANYIGYRLGKTTLTLDAVHQAIPFYNKLGFINTSENSAEDNTVSMEKQIEPRDLPVLPRIVLLRQSTRKKNGGYKRSDNKKKRKQTKNKMQ